MGLQRRFGAGPAGVVVFWAALSLPHSGAAQLISPGRLAAPHAELSGLRNCTQCHELGRSGIAPDRCLACHDLVSSLVDSGRGYHATVAERNCAECHKDHLGEDFAMVRLDSLAFDHDEAGYPLEGRHRSADCRSCHEPARIVDPAVRSAKSGDAALAATYLGLASTCAACHGPEDPHANQFDGRECSDCHGVRTWEGADAFDHTDAAFTLTGRHDRVDCLECHTATTPDRGGLPVTTWSGLEYAACNACHRDPHTPRMPVECVGCHVTEGWLDLPTTRLRATFDHGVTDFPLLGGHVAAACSACHDPRLRPSAPAVRMSFGAPGGVPGFALPAHDGCISCHADEHGDAMVDDCAACHTAARWAAVETARLEAAFDHAGIGFALEGRHASAPCAACHDPARTEAAQHLSITFADPLGASSFPAPLGDPSRCLTCHLDRHGGELMDRSDGGDCGACHVATAWVPTTWDAARHDAGSAFTLDGAHLVVACSDCHTPAPSGPPRLRLDDASCRSCHGGVNPHDAQFVGRDCAECHATGAFTVPDFDHDATRFALDGAHRSLDCSACHTPYRDASGGTRTRYRPLGVDCRDCHGDPP